MSSLEVHELGSLASAIIQTRQQAPTATSNPIASEDEFGLDLDYDEDLEKAIQAVEDSQRPVNKDVNDDPKASSDVQDIEDLSMEVIEERLSPFNEFRRKGFLSVSDLVGTVWCEVQYDYRLRTMPYLPPSQRPDTIKSIAGKEIKVDKVKVEDKERILRRGNTIHKRLEREIHPVEIKVTATTREDVWGLRFLNMLSALEALITIGTCRELPVVGFVNGIMIMGIIDEIVRKPIQAPSTPSTPEKRSSLRQANLTSFFSPTKSKPETAVERQPRTHRLFVSDSKTRANGALPRESDTLAGRLQVMLYKELLDTILLASARRQYTSGVTIPEIHAPSDEQPATEASSSTNPRAVLPSSSQFSFSTLFTHLLIDPATALSDDFITQSRSIIDGNGLKYGAKDAHCLNDLIDVWDRYVNALGLGSPQASSRITSEAPPSVYQKAKGKRKAMDEEPDLNAGRTEPDLALVYRRAGAVKRHRKPRKKDDGKVDKRKGKRRGRRKAEDIVEPDMEGSNVVVPPEHSDEELAEESQAVQVDDDVRTDLTLEVEEEEEDRLLASVIEESKRSFDQGSINYDDIGTSNEGNSPQDQTNQTSGPQSDDTIEYWQGPKRSSSEEREEEELAWAVEMSLGGLDEAMTFGDEGEDVILRASQTVSDPAPSDNKPTPSSDDDKIPSSPPVKAGTMSGSIIGRHKFRHDPKLLSQHLESVLQFWMGLREPRGVGLEEAGRCAWCEFENDCEWRSKKAREAWEAVELRRVKRD